MTIYCIKLFSGTNSKSHHIFTNHHFFIAILFRIKYYVYIAKTGKYEDYPMRHLKIKLCDDEKYFLDELQELILSTKEELKCDMTVTPYQGAESMLQDILEKQEECHIAFLDVDMPGLSGVEAAKKLREAGYEGVICFVTSHDEYAFEAYQVEALGYITKPARYDDVKKLLNRASIEVYYRLDAEEAKKRYLEVMCKGRKLIVDLLKVLYIEKYRNQAIFHMEDGQITCYETLKSVHSRLNQEKFVYCHQGYIVNFDKIKQVCEKDGDLGYGCLVPLSRKYQPKLRERHMDMIRRLRDK